jgi:hypothetical protein
VKLSERVVAPVAPGRQNRGMSEVARRATNALANAVGNTVSPGVAALCVTAGLSIQEATAIGASAGALTQEAVTLIAERRRHVTRRVERFAATAEEESGLTLEDLLIDASRDERKLELLGRTVEAAARSLEDRKIDLLARTYVHGVHDGDRIDQALIITGALRELETPHLLLLAAMRTPGPVLIHRRSNRDPNPGRERQSIAQRAAVTAWSAQAVEHTQPVLRGGVEAVASRLVSLGLIQAIWDEAEARQCWVTTPFGHQCMQHLQQRGEAAGGTTDVRTR